jgi:5'-nucleotidase
VPRVTTGEFRVTVQAKRNHVTQVDERVDPKHRTYYWIDEAIDEWERNPQSDYHAVREGYVSVTPLQPDLTAHDALGAVGALLAGRLGDLRSTKKVVRAKVRLR